MIMPVIIFKQFYFFFLFFLEKKSLFNKFQLFIKMFDVFNFFFFLLLQFCLFSYFFLVVNFSCTILVNTIFHLFFSFFAKNCIFFFQLNNSRDFRNKIQNLFNLKPNFRAYYEKKDARIFVFIF